MNKKYTIWKDVVKDPVTIRGLIAAFLYLLMLTRVFGLLTLDASLLLDVRLKITPTIFFDAIAKQVAFDRDAYLVFHLIDYLFILSFYPFLRMITKRLFLRSLIPSFAFIAGGADVLENVCIDVSLLLFPTQVTGFALIVAVLTPLKFFCVGCILIASTVRLIQLKQHKGLS